MSPGYARSAHILLYEACLLNREWRTAHGPLTSEMLERALKAIRLATGLKCGASASVVGDAMGLERPAGWRPGTFSDRRTDRALQLLKRAGLIEFDRKARAWRATR